jgi:hypothetical protein
MNAIEYTRGELEKIKLTDNTPINEDLLLSSGENWGEPNVGTIENWEREIPENENDAAATGWWDWYICAKNHNQDMAEEMGESAGNVPEITWPEYRQELLSQLHPVKIIES